MTRSKAVCLYWVLVLELQGPPEAERIRRQGRGVPVAILFRGEGVNRTRGAAFL